MGRTSLFAVLSSGLLGLLLVLSAGSGCPSSGYQPASSLNFNSQADPSPIHGKLTASASQVNVGTPVTFTISDVTGGVPPYTYHWFLEGDPTWGVGEASVPRTMTQTPSQSVTAYVSDSVGGRSTDVTVTVSVTPVPVTGKISASAAQVDYGAIVTFTVSDVQGGVPPYNYFWWLDGDTHWTEGGPTYGRTLTQTPSQTMKTYVVDSTGVKSKVGAVTVSVKVAEIAAKLHASANPVDAGASVTFTADVTGGVPPYEYWWLLEGDTAYTNAGSSYTRPITKTPKQSMSLLVRDSTGKDSIIFSIDVSVNEAVVSTCPSIAGYWESDWAGFVSFMLRVEGNKVTGHYDNLRFLGDCYNVIEGTLTQGADGCPDCLVLTGTWDDDPTHNLDDPPPGQPAPAPCGTVLCCEPLRGSIQITFYPGWARFTAKYGTSFEPNWRPYIIGGYRDWVWGCNGPDQWPVRTSQ